MPAATWAMTGGVDGLMQKSSNNTIMGRVKAGEAAGRCRRTAASAWGSGTSSIANGSPIPFRPFANQAKARFRFNPEDQPVCGFLPWSLSAGAPTLWPDVPAAWSNFARRSALFRFCSRTKSLRKSLMSAAAMCTKSCSTSFRSRYAYKAPRVKLASRTRSGLHLNFLPLAKCMSLW